jgi:hypothetical protein
MSPALARIKRALIDGITKCGGIEGAAATADRKRSVAGDWRNLNKQVFPSLDCALALDEVVVAGGGLPPIISAMARELGGMFVPHIDAFADEGTASCKVLELAQHLGNLSGDIAAALANDGIIDSVEAAHALIFQQRLHVATAQLGALLSHIRDSHVLPLYNKGDT